MHSFSAPPRSALAIGLNKVRFSWSAAARRYRCFDTNSTMAMESCVGIEKRTRYRHLSCRVFLALSAFLSFSPPFSTFASFWCGFADSCDPWTKRARAASSETHLETLQHCRFLISHHRGFLISPGRSNVDDNFDYIDGMMALIQIPFSYCVSYCVCAQWLSSFFSHISIMFLYFVSLYESFICIFIREAQNFTLFAETLIIF